MATPVIHHLLAGWAASAPDVTIAAPTYSATWVRVIATVTTVDTVEFQRNGVTVQNTASTVLADTGLTQGTAYTYRARSVVGGTPGAWSPEVVVTTRTPGTMITSFSGETAGAIPTGWQNVWRISPPNTVVDSPHYSSSRALVSRDTGRYSARRSCVWTAAGTHLNVEVLARVRFESVVSADVQLFARLDIASASGAETSLQGEIGLVTTRNVNIRRFLGGVWANAATASALLATPATWYQMRLKFDALSNGNGQYRLKVWPDNEAEPLSWSVDTGERSELLGQFGYVGIGANNYGAVELDAIAVAWDGATVPSLPTLPSVPVYHPSAPTGLSVIQSGSNVTVSWTAASGVAGYKVLRNGKLVGTTANTTFTDVAPPVGQHTYTVHSYVST